MLFTPTFPLIFPSSPRLAAPQLTLIKLAVNQWSNNNPVLSRRLTDCRGLLSIWWDAWFATDEHRSPANYDITVPANVSVKRSAFVSGKDAMDWKCSASTFSDCHRCSRSPADGGSGGAEEWRRWSEQRQAGWMKDFYKAAAAALDGNWLRLVP